MVNYVMPHDPSWAAEALSEAKAIQIAHGTLDLTLHHIGSTTIPGILAKPIIDLLGEVADLASLDAASKTMRDLGYEVMGAYGIDGRRYFRKTDANGRRTRHLHIFTKGSPHIERHLAFRDYLRAHGEVAAAYSALKAQLTRDDACSWDTYLDEKAPFVRQTERAALVWYRSNRPS